MSFGFSIGDFIAVLQLAQKLWKQFSNAPSQYQAIASEVKNASHVLQEVAVYKDTISDASQQAKLSDVISSLCQVLKETEKIVVKCSSLESSPSGLKGRARRIWAQAKFEPADVRDLRQRIISNLVVLNSIVGGLDRGNLARLVRIQDLQQTTEILDWLAERDYAAQHSSHLSRHLPGTGQWMLDSPEFQDWVNGRGSQGLLLQGIPGIGKTILTAIIIDHLQGLYAPGDNVGICYHYCDYSRQKNTGESDGLHSDDLQLGQILLRFIRQLSDSHSTITPFVQNLYNKYRRLSSISIDLKELRTTFYSCAQSFDKVYIVIDALDECQMADGCRRTLLKELVSMSETRDISVIATSRVLPDITHTLRAFKAIEIKASDEDISRFIDLSISKLPNFVAQNNDLQTNIKTAIIASADGIFLLASLHIQSLRGKKSVSALRKALNNFSVGASAYTEAYDKTMKRIIGQVEDQKELAIDTLTWIVYAQRPLKIQELQHALATNVNDSEFDFDNISDTADILSACCGLVIVEPDSELVRLVHRTAQEFFKDPQCTWLTGVHDKLTRICLAYLSFVGSNDSNGNTTNETYKKQLARYPLWEYASWNWQDHAELQETPMSLKEFATRQKQVDASSQMLMDHAMPEYLQLSRENPGVTGLHLLSLCGSTSLLPIFLQSHDLDARDRYQHSPISYAVQEGHVDVVTLLINAGACLDGLYDLQDKTKIQFDLRPKIQDRKTFRYNLRPRRRYEDQDDRTPLQEYAQHLLLWAIKFRPDIASLLIKGGAQPDVVDSQGRNALHWAVRMGAEDQGRLLLQKGLDPWLVDTINHTPMFYAVKWQDVSGIELLLSATNKTATRIDEYDRVGQQCLSKSNGDGFALFMAAATDAKFKTCSWLLKAGFVIDTQDSDGRTALMEVAGESTKHAPAILAFLLKHGAKIDSVDNSGLTALLYALGWYQNDLWEYYTTDEHVKVPYGVIHPNKGNEDVVLFLLERGADIHTADNDGVTALMGAVLRPTEDMAALLLKKGARVNDVDDEGRSALFYAIKWSAKDRIIAFVTLLLKHGADIGIRTRTGRTILDDAVIHGHAEIVQLLLNKNTNENKIPGYADTTADGNGDGNHCQNRGGSPWSALHWACRIGNVEILKLLINAGIRSSIVSTEMTVPPRFKWTPLDIAYFWNRTELLQYVRRMHTRQDPIKDTMISSGLVVTSTGGQRLMAARENNLSKALNGDLDKECESCGSVDSLILLEDPIDICFMCKHLKAVQRMAIVEH